MVSLHLAKCREIKRRDAKRKDEKPPDFTAWRWRSQTWDTHSSALFVFGAVLALTMLSRVEVRPAPQVGRFQPYLQSTAGVLLDTQSGQLCAPQRAGFEGIVLCTELAQH